MASQARLPGSIRSLERPYNYVSQALAAASYPLQGIYYFLRHPAFYPLFLGRLLPLSIISTLVYMILFIFTFLPQFAFLAIFHGRAAWLNAVVLVLGEGLVIIQGLFEGFFVDECRVDVFDVRHPSTVSFIPSRERCAARRRPGNCRSRILANPAQATLINEDLEHLVAPHRVLFPDAPNSVKKLGKPTSAAVYQPWSLIQIVELLVCLPLNLIPYFGTPAFLIITGARLGTFAHYRWFELRGLNKKERKLAIRNRSWEYTWFGTIAMILELIPILSFFFLVTSTAGSALWAAKLEQQVRLSPEAPGEVPEQDPDEPPPPPYVDNPV
ncbi:hypothetical protein F5B21DRAFT_27071 [Xylaria acuta]|nr:hypothetical protein F5B21DRAFT_27071 [Xylaria acuta]